VTARIKAERAGVGACTGMDVDPIRLQSEASADTNRGVVDREFTDT
jgi:hypothetical protein